MKKSELLDSARAVIRESKILPRALLVRGITINIADVAADQMNFREQTQLLHGADLPAFAAALRDAETGQMVEVPVDVGLRGTSVAAINDAVENFRGLIANWIYGVRQVTHSEADELFRERVAETVTARVLAAGGGWAGKGGPETYPVEVAHSVSGTRLLYAKGYFLSTQEHLGYSTCSTRLPAGRYSFGAEVGGSPRFDGVLVAVPLLSSPVQVLAP